MAVDPETRRAQKAAANKVWAERNPGRVNEIARAGYKKARLTVLEYYGNKCICCGEAQILFLTIDHINRDGAKQKEELGTRGSNLYRKIIALGFPDDLQVLCYNCNCGREYNNGICPHKGVQE